MPGPFSSMNADPNLMRTFINVFRNAAFQVPNQFCEEVANEFKDELQFRIASQAFGHRPLNPAYRMGKVRARLDPRILIATGEYLESFTVEDLSSREHQERHGIEGPGFVVGVRDGIHSGSRLPYRVMARIHEFGTSRIPARPHWRPMSAIYRRRSAELGRRLQVQLATNVRDGLATSN